MTNYILKRREFLEIRQRGFGYGRVASYGKWRTLQKYSTLKMARVGFDMARNRPGLFQCAVFFAGKRIDLDKEKEQ